MFSYKIILLAFLAVHFPSNVRSIHYVYYPNWTNLTDCHIPSNCRVEKVSTIIDASGIERMMGKDKLGLRCDIHNDGFSFNFNISEVRDEHFKPRCFLKIDSADRIVELRWPKSSTQTLKAGLNISNLFNFMYDINFGFNLNLVNIKRFELNLLNLFNDDEASLVVIERILCSNCKFDFYINGNTTLKTCEDFIQANVINIQSIFQMYRLKFINFEPYMLYINYTIINGDFKQPLCPLVFNN